MTKHYTEADFLDRLYEIGREDGHLEECADCRAGYETWLAARKQITHPPEVPAGLLLQQRQQILERAGQPLGLFRNIWRWSPALAAAAAVLFAILWNVPGPKPAVIEAPAVVETAQATDAQVMAEIYKTVYDVEPQAVAPLRGLFEDRGQAND